MGKGGCIRTGKCTDKAKPVSTDLLSTKRTDKKIVDGWKQAIETYQFGGLTTEERHMFERMALMERQMKEKTFVLP